MKLLNFLNSKQIYYKRINYTHIKDAYKIIQKHFILPNKIIHIVGTNGKGTTGRFLAYYLYKSGFDTLHYSSPHILKFNERIWINGSDAKTSLLNKAHKNLYNILPKILLRKLSYFEYTTLLAFILSHNKDYLILEAGLGGEFDATNIIKSDISIVTPIDYDHQEFLGKTIKQIATTKLKSVKNHLIISNQKYHQVIKIAKKLSLKNNFTITYQEELLTSYEKKLIKTFLVNNNFASYLFQNLSLALNTIKFLGLDLNIHKLKNITINARMQQISKNIYIDVGHNKLAAQVIKQEFINKKINLIYNSAKDKDYTNILKILSPIIDTLYPIKCKNSRIEDIKTIKTVSQQLKINTKEYKNLKYQNDQIYLVFGSFMVIEQFLKDYDIIKANFSLK